MKRTFSDGRSEVVLPPQDFPLRLCALIPPPRANCVRYFGAFAPYARGRAAVVGSSRAKPGPALPRAEAPVALDDPSVGDPPPAADRPRRLDWAALLQRVYKMDVLVCRACGGRLRVIAFLTDVRVVRRILDHLGIELVVLPRARPPPRPTCSAPRPSRATRASIRPPPTDARSTRFARPPSAWPAARLPDLRNNVKFLTLSARTEPRSGPSVDPPPIVLPSAHAPRGRSNAL